MKRFIYYTLICCATIALGACNHTDELDSIQADGGQITITTLLGDQVATRAADTEVERTVTHIDIFVVKSDDGSVAHYERSSVGNGNGAAEDGAGQLTLSVKRADAKFVQGAKYTFYLVANATISSADAAAKTTLAALEEWVQSEAVENAGLQTSWLHVTGTKLGGGTPPQTFLMQAIAGEAAGQVVNSASGNGDALKLSASLERAAAKIVVNISQGENVSFYQQLTNGTEQGSALYYFNMLPVKSFVLPKNTVQLAQQELVTTIDLGPNNNTFVWTPQTGSTAENPNHKLQVVGYAYAHAWGDIDPQDATALVVNIPIKWDKNGDAADGNEHIACNSWYKIPLSKDKKFERNKCYQVDVVINTAGADDRTSVVELDDIEFETLPWIDVAINVGNSNKPEYLNLNTDLVKIYNTNSDNKQLSFSSSSPITSITLKSAYYKNKYSTIVDLSNQIRSTINATCSASALNGPITITSPIIQQQGSTTVETHYNTIRYLEFEVVNQQELTATFRVEQYPLIYITNIVGWYSYRDDFKTSSAQPTTYLNKGDRIVNISYRSNQFVKGTDRDRGFWRSKVNTKVQTAGTYNESDQTQINSYYWSSNAEKASTSSSNIIGNNARMYHVRVTATSSEYTVARPKIVDATNTEIGNVQNGYTEGSEANSRIVSPSFMIASQLGAVNTGTDHDKSFGIDADNYNFTRETAREHCKNYVEVAADGRVFDDWRLPTNAEIEIIIGLQASNDSNAAIDQLLTATYYISAYNYVSTSGNNTGGGGWPGWPGYGGGFGGGVTAFRCIRDAYDVNDR